MHAQCNGFTEVFTRIQIISLAFRKTWIPKQILTSLNSKRPNHKLQHGVSYAVDI